MIALFVVWLLVGLLAYGLLWRKIYPVGAQVATDNLGPPDAGLACFFATWFAWLTWTGFAAKEHNVTPAELVAGALHFTVIVGVIAGFLMSRKISVCRQFGINRIGVSKAVYLGGPLLLAAFPLVGFAGWIMLKLIGAEAKPQELVRFFTEASDHGKMWEVIFTMGFGVILAPMAEEFIFRGYLYTTAKKYLGFLPAMLLVSALFAAIHLNLASLPSLFILAICFTIAYESSGSILVPMAMHALFNFTEFSFMLSASHLTK